MDEFNFVWQSVRVDGYDVHYRVAGPVDAPVMVHVHGFAISGTYMLPTAALLTDQFRVYVPDLPGFGRSPKPPRVLSIVELGTVLNHFMDALGIERATLVGNSLGCAITAELIDEDREKVERAIMVGPAGGRWNRPLAKAVGQMVRDGLVEPPKLMTVAAPDYLRFGPIRAIRLFSEMTQYPAYERFMALPLPALMVIGSQDPLRPSWARMSKVMAEIPPGITIVLFQGAAHAINFTHPRELTHLIRQYISGQEIRMDAGNPDGVPVLQLKRPV